MIKTNAGEVVGTKVGWRVKEWAHDTGLSRALVYVLLPELDSVKVRAARIILTPPAEFLARQAKAP